MELERLGSGAEAAGGGPPGDTAGSYCCKPLAVGELRVPPALGAPCTAEQQILKLLLSLYDHDSGFRVEELVSEIPS